MWQLTEKETGTIFFLKKPNLMLILASRFQLKWEKKKPTPNLTNYLKAKNFSHNGFSYNYALKPGWTIHLTACSEIFFKNALVSIRCIYPLVPLGFLPSSTIIQALWSQEYLLCISIYSTVEHYIVTPRQSNKSYW